MMDQQYFGNKTFNNSSKLALSLGLLSLATLSFAGNVSAHDDGIVNLGSMQATTLGQERGLAVSGRVMILRRNNGTTSAYTQVLGLAPLTSYGAHVHNLPCDLGGGGHYKNDLDVSGAEQANEIWVSFTTDESGKGLSQGTGEFLARPEAQSIVVHDTDGGRIACANLHQNYEGATVHKGAMENFADGSVFGHAQINRSNGSSYASLHLVGLAADTQYPSHVHNLPCNVKSGGSHYKIDPAESTTIADNELWLTVTTDAEGNGSSDNGNSHHTARPEAQSVVVHDPNGGRLGCADLHAEESEKVKTRGTPITTAAGLSSGYDLSGKAKMSRKDNGRTEVEVEVKGLQANMRYPTHVHNLPCRMGGGGHYKIDPSITETMQSNEIWPIIATKNKAKGKGKIKVHHIARPEAQSIVIHDPSSGARIGCFDLD